MAAAAPTDADRPDPDIDLIAAEAVDPDAQLAAIRLILDKMVDTRAQWTTTEARAYEELTAREVELLAQATVDHPSTGA